MHTYLTLTIEHKIIKDDYSMFSMIKKLLFLPGLFLHEVSHYVMCKLLNIKVTTRHSALIL